MSSLYSSNRQAPLPMLRLLLCAQLRLLLLRAQLGLQVGLGSVLRAAFLVSELEGKE